MIENKNWIIIKKIFKNKILLLSEYYEYLWIILLIPRSIESRNIFKCTRNRWIFNHFSTRKLAWKAAILHVWSFFLSKTIRLSVLYFFYIIQCILRCTLSWYKNVENIQMKYDN